jgi:exodeoxyribonuclease VII small subunit
MPQAKQSKTYKQLAEELEKLVDWFEGDEVNLDDAVIKYEQALELLAQMERHLKTAENKVKNIALKFEDS